MRLDKMLANAGHGTRNEVKKALKQGVVEVDGAVVKDGKLHVQPERQSVCYAGTPVRYKAELYLMLNKPAGVVTATEDARQKTVLELVKNEWGHMKPFPVGRLDKDTTGLLLLTTDGGFSHELMAPKKHVAKEYRALVEGKVTQADVEAFKNGVVLDDGYCTKPAQLEIEESGPLSAISLELTEGKFHQVKRMFAAVGKKVIKLERVRIGSLMLDSSLPKGGYRELTPAEIQLAKTPYIKKKSL
ncbi:pseudouridine synthase [Shouchella clausii]|jgi:16S rRNA pseudouridine516 synthase|uniref:pseudouridine synthase n=1 Tax=Shouchella clausii TaxID=79880 RepID=UPI000BA7E2DE|nr:pseudouridine synthase [Shouchella clausii]PAD41449.1 16S rRNA pseudouridine(516) synthase [Bacillus sp. 7520-S]MBU8597627.1 rRNA pseudouridine synthase [Shouchella clausii]MCY1105282.1 pseudouridine synthase [Shouchella clausii]MEB5482330.1 pseudouridine synthase [Shouchella clausii]MED4159546.1 pseudouridine synthase [Shouchella clausii]